MNPPAPLKLEPALHEKPWGSEHWTFQAEGLLTKVIEARATLSVQVHPDAEAALELGSDAKTEAWYVLSVEPGARIYKGLREGVRPPALLGALERGEVESLLHWFEPSAGDVVFLPAGTVHAIGGGCVLYELQQDSDTTYRLYDWGSERELHVKQAVRCADFSGPGLERVAPRVLAEDGRYRIAERVSCPWFVLEEHEFMGLVTFEAERRQRPCWHVLYVLAGHGVLRAHARGAEELEFGTGDSVLLPVAHERFDLEPAPGVTVRLLDTWVP